MHRAWSPLPLTAWPIQMDSSSVELDKTAENVLFDLPIFCFHSVSLILDIDAW